MTQFLCAHIISIIIFPNLELIASTDFVLETVSHLESQLAFARASWLFLGLSSTLPRLLHKLHQPCSHIIYVIMPSVPCTTAHKAFSF